MQLYDIHGNRVYGAWGRERISRAALIFLMLVLGFGSIAAVTQIDLTTQVKNILGIGNGGTGLSSIAAGLLRSSGSALSSAELSGDVTTSGSNVATVAKVNGTSVGTNAAANQALITTASATAGWASLGDTSAGGLAETYNGTTHQFGTITVLSGSFADNETPTGSCPITSLTLAHSPSPAASLSLYYNGQLLVSGGADYSLSGAAVTLTSSCPSGSILRASYRY